MSDVRTPLKAKGDKNDLRCSSTPLYSAIPRFWWPKHVSPPESGFPELTRRIHEHFLSENITGIVAYTQLIPLVSDVFGLSKYFAAPILHKIKVFFKIIDDSLDDKATLLTDSTVPITEKMLLGWCKPRIDLDDPVLTFFSVVRGDHSTNSDDPYIVRDDLNIFLTATLLTHPGLEFLKDTQEFQDRYADTVISRIFFVNDRRDLGQIHLSDLRRYKPSIVETWKSLDESDDMRTVRDYFSYEHFYVIYCTFWDLDADHDFLLDRDDLLKYDGHALSRRAIDRIFSQISTRFTSAVPGKMGYDDFIRFLLCDQDRATDRAIEYWFRLFDIDGDETIRQTEMSFFYEEQMQRMECLNFETIPFEDVMCQMNDMILPEIEGQFRLSDFKRRRKQAGTFFSLLSSLTKFLSFEHRDPVVYKQETLDNPDMSDWDRWCADEYLRLAAESDDNPEDDDTQATSFLNSAYVDDISGVKGSRGVAGRGRV